MPRSFAGPLSSWRFASISVDIGKIVLRDVRQVDPTCLQTWSRNLLNACELFELDLAKPGIIDFWCLRQGGPGRRRRLPGQDRLNKCLYVIVQYPAFGAATFDLDEVYPELASQFANRRARMRPRETGLIDRRQGRRCRRRYRPLLYPPLACSRREPALPASFPTRFRQAQLLRPQALTLQRR